MEYKHNHKLINNARNLRKNMTKEERHLWYDFLRNYPHRFYRQKVIAEYIVDFYCAEAKLVIELDGSQHFSEKGIEQDAVRSEFLEQYGLKILRIANNEIFTNFEGVCTYIDYEVKQRLYRTTPPSNHTV